MLSPDKNLKIAFFGFKKSKLTLGFGIGVCFSLKTAESLRIESILVKGSIFILGIFILGINNI